MSGRDWLSETIGQFQAELQAMSCLEVNVPRNLQTENKINAVFHKDRWMKGYGQHTEKIYDRMGPALRLASLMLTERAMVGFWTHLVFGHLKTGINELTGLPGPYIEPRPKEESTEGRREAREIQRELAEVIVFMFTPEQYKDHELYGRAWGVTTNKRGGMPWSHHFKDSDYPRITHEHREWKREGFSLPEVTLCSEFQYLFTTGYDHYTPAQRYRVLFMFAITIVHEYAHAFWYFLGKRHHRDFRGEPLITVDAPQAELGFAWESLMMGRICNPLYGVIHNCGPLLSIKTFVWNVYNPQAREHTIRRAIGVIDGLTSRQIPAPQSLSWIPAHNWRGNQYWLQDQIPPNMSMLCVVKAIPMKWVLDWFTNDFWEDQSDKWHERRSLQKRGWYQNPRLGPTWSLVFLLEANGNSGCWINSRWEGDPDWEDAYRAAEHIGLFGNGGGSGVGWR